MSHTLSMGIGDRAIVFLLLVVAGFIVLPLKIAVLYTLFCLTVAFWLIYNQKSYFTKRGIPSPKGEWITGHGRIVFENMATFDGDTMKELGTNYFGNFITIKTGEDWKRVRNRVTPAFTTGKIKKIIPTFNECAKRSFGVIENHIAQGKEVDLKALTGQIVMDVIGHGGFSMDFDVYSPEESPLLVNAKKAFSGFIRSWRVAFTMLCPVFTEKIEQIFGIDMLSNESHQFFEKFLLDLYDKRKGDPLAKEKYNDIFQLLLNVVDEDADELHNNEKAQEDSDIIHKELWFSDRKKFLTKAEQISQSFLIFIAGYETTSTVLHFVLYLLALHPDIQDKLRRELNEVVGDEEEITFEHMPNLIYMNQVIQETLRMYPQAPRLNRQCTESITLNGFRIEEGDVINFPVSALHYDPKYYPDPHNFDPERFTEEEKSKRDPRVYLPFGIGPRNCLGMRFAEFQMRVVLGQLVKNFNFEKGENSPELPIKIVFDGVLRPEKTLFAKRWLPRSRKPITAPNPGDLVPFTRKVNGASESGMLNPDTQNLTADSESPYPKTPECQKYRFANFSSSLSIVMAFRGKIFALREQTSKNALAKQNVAQDNKENVAVPESVPFDSSVRGSASGHGRGSHTVGFQNDYGQKAQDPPLRQEGHDFGDLTASKFGNYARGGNVRGIPRGGGMTRDVNNQNDYGPKAQDSPSRQEGQDFGDSTAPKFGNYTRGNGRGSSRGYGMARDFNSEIPKETPAIQKNEFAHDMNQNIVTRGAHFGRGRGESFAGFSGYNEPRAVSETAKEAPVMQPFSSQNEVPRGGLSNVRGSRGGRGGIHYGEDASGRAEPPVVSETVKEAPASQITTPVQDVGQNGVARGGFGNSRGGYRVGYNRGEDLPGYNPPVDASYGRPLTLPQAQSGEKREGSSDKVQPWHISTSVGQTPLTQPPPVTVNGGAEIKSIFKKAVSQAAAKEHGDDVHISKADFANLAHLLNEMATSFNTLNAFLQQLVKKF